MCEYLGVLATVRAREYWLCWTVYLSLRKVKVQRVIVVKFGMYNRFGHGVGCFEVKIATNAEYSWTIVLVAGSSVINNWLMTPFTHSFIFELSIRTSVRRSSAHLRVSWIYGSISIKLATINR